MKPTQIAGSRRSARPVTARAGVRGQTAPGKPRFFKSPADFRRWLARHHEDARELEVGFYNKRSGRAGITYSEALDQALCFGWIDGVRRRLDEHRFSIRFTPRKTASHWSRINIDRVHALREAGLVAAAGLRAFEARGSGEPLRYSDERAQAVFDPAHERSFRRHAAAWTFFMAQPPSYQRVTRYWVESAKREETRSRRLELLIAYSARRLRLSMFAPNPKLTG
jgi:uncharacterized protein YdeI (YjbR/CyaY-like superfamily)